MSGFDCSGCLKSETLSCFWTGFKIIMREMVVISLSFPTVQSFGLHDLVEFVAGETH